MIILTSSQPALWASASIAFSLLSLSRKIAFWRATVDEDGHYSFAVAL